MRGPFLRCPLTKKRRQIFIVVSVLSAASLSQIGAELRIQRKATQAKSDLDDKAILQIPAPSVNLSSRTCA
jgi:hypothetical protein